MKLLPALWNLLKQAPVDLSAHRSLRRLEARLRRARRSRAHSRQKVPRALDRSMVDQAPRDDAQLILHTTAASLPGDGILRPTSAPTLIVSSLLLRESFRLATELPEEGMHFMASVEIDGADVAVRLVDFPYTRRTVVGAAGDHRASHQAAIDLLELGHRIGALVHSHPGMGVEATHPSSIDLRTHRLWERASPLAGGIFSRDGFVRWYWADRPVQVRVVGDGVQEVEPNVWRLLSL